MNYTDRQGLTEDASLTRGGVKGFKLRCYEDSGLKITVISFTVLSIALTLALGLQLVYNVNVLESSWRHGAVATDNIDCTQIGTDVLRKGGNAVDAAIAATICLAVVSPHKTGLGGGGYAMIYSHEDREKPIIIDFAKNTVGGAFGRANNRLPALMKGLELAHSLQGSLPWELLVSPSSELARQGFIVTKEFSRQENKDPNVKPYGQLEPGKNLTLLKLSETLDIIAKYGVTELYNGSLSHTFVHDSPEVLHQLATYEPQVKHAMVTNFYDNLIYYPPDASTLVYTLEMIEALRIPYANASTVESQVLLANALINNKNIHSKTEATGAEESFSSVVVMDGSDSYVVIVTGLSFAFGHGRLTDAGFLMDSAESMLDKLTPVLFCDAVSVCGLRGIIGTDDVTLTTELFYNLMVRKLNVSAAIENPRYYLLPDGISIESDYPYQMDPMLRTQLSSMLNPSHQNADHLLKSYNAIVKLKDAMSSHSDSRGGGIASTF